ncbi:alpha/beta fold hydrolase [Rhodovibrio salinarum]|nr:alpha/beta hydrolase [Rhodovibrio salinarum]
MRELTLAQRFNSDQGQIAYDRFGDGPDVVLVHGTPFRGLIWRDVVDRLSERFRCHVLDLPGYGESDKYEGQEVRLRSFARVLTAFIVNQQLEKPVLIGHDFGAAAVLGAHLVEAVPVRAIAVVDGVVLSPWGTEYARLVNQAPETFNALPGYVHQAILAAHIATAAERPLSTDWKRALIAPWMGPQGQAAYHRQIQQFDFAYTDRLETLYPAMDVPTRVFWGECDQWVPPAVGRRLVELIPDAGLTLLPDAGHLAMLDTPGLLARELGQWLSEVHASG